MCVHPTGASGCIGSATIDELLSAAREVIRFARSEEFAAATEPEGAAARRGDHGDLDSRWRGTGADTGADTDIDTDIDTVLLLAYAHNGGWSACRHTVRPLIQAGVA